MLNLMLETSGGTNVFSLVIVLVLIALMVVYLVFGMINRKKSQEQMTKMLNDLKVGDKVVTNAGIYGEIVLQKETNMGRIVVLKTGDEDGARASYITVNASVILGIDTKHDLILDENGNVVEPEDLKEEILKPAGDEPQTKKVAKKSTKSKSSDEKGKKTKSNRKSANAVAEKR